MGKFCLLFYEINDKNLKMFYLIGLQPHKLCLFQEEDHGKDQQKHLSVVQPSHISYLYWEARAQGFHDLRGKLFAEAFLRLLFSGIDSINISYSTDGYDTHLDRWGYIREGPTQRESRIDGHDESWSSETSLSSREKLVSMLKGVDGIEFDLKLTSQKVTSDVFVTKGNDLILIADIANRNDIEQKKIQQLHLKMLMSLDKHKKLFGMLIQGHQVYLTEYAFDHVNGYSRIFSKKAFKYKVNHIEILFSYLRNQLNQTQK